MAQQFVQVSVENLNPKAGRFAGKTVHDALVIRAVEGKPKGSRALDSLPLPDYVVENITNGRKKQVMYKSNRSYAAVRQALQAGVKASSKKATSKKAAPAKQELSLDKQPQMDVGTARIVENLIRMGEKVAAAKFAADKGYTL